MDQYSILGRIGEGAHGIVFKAKHIEVSQITGLSHDKHSKRRSVLAKMQHQLLTFVNDGKQRVKCDKCNVRSVIEHFVPISFEIIRCLVMLAVLS